MVTQCAAASNHSAHWLLAPPEELPSRVHCALAVMEIEWLRQKHEVSSWGGFQTRHKHRCGRDVVPLLSDTREGQEELDDGHHEPSLGSGDSLTSMIK